MKKRILLMLLAMVLILSTAGCGEKDGSKDDSSTAENVPGNMEIAVQKLTNSEKSILGLAGLDMGGMTSGPAAGPFVYKIDETVKTIQIKIVEYTSKSGRWKNVSGASQFQPDAGPLMITYYDSGKTALMAVSDGKAGTSSSEASDLTELSADTGMMTTDLKKAAIELNKEIPVHMIGELKPEVKGGNAPNLEAYPKTDAFKEYQKVRAIVVVFSDKDY